MELTDANYKKEIEDYNGVVLVDFWADWCTPCKILEPVLVELEKEYTGKVKVMMMDADKNPETIQKYSIMSLPTLVVFKNGQPVNSLIGVQPKDTIAAIMDEALE